jgi:tetratricopeptide (TPR) repeat protein
VAKDPKRTDALRTIAAIHFRAKNFGEANALYKKIQEIEPRALDIHNNQGWTLYREQKYAEAIAKFNESIRIYRYYGEPHYGLGMCYAKLGEIDKAKESFTTAIYLYPAYMDGQDLYNVFDSNPKLREMYNAMGWSYFYNYSYNSAKFHFDRLLKADPLNRDALLGLGTVSYVLGEYKDAAGTLGKLVAGIPATADAWDKWSYMLDNLGWSHYLLKDYDKAREAFRRLETYHPKVRYIAPINGMAWTELQKGNKAEAERIFAASLKIVPGNYGAEAGMRELKK